MADDALKSFAEAILARDFASAHDGLSESLKKALPAAALERLIQSRIERMASAMDISGPAWPVGYELDENSISYDDLKRDTPELPPEVTGANYAGWACIQFLASEDCGIDAWLDLWCVLVRDGGVERVGYLEPADPD